MFNAENLQEKWSPVLNHDGLPEIKDNYRKAVTAILLENQEKALREERAGSHRGTNQRWSYQHPNHWFWRSCWFRPNSDLPDQTRNA